MITQGEQDIIKMYKEMARETRKITDILEGSIDIAQKTNCELTKISTDDALKILKFIKAGLPDKVVEECESPHIVGRRVGLCPRCGRYLSSSIEPEKWITYHCNGCGQALKWTFTEDI